MIWSMRKGNHITKPSPWLQLSMEKTTELVVGEVKKEAEQNAAKMALINFNF